MTHEPTAEQKAIAEFVRFGKGNLVIEALAGSGKTHTLIESLKVIPQRSILLTAFNRPIADTLQAKVDGLKLRTHAIHVKTFHALGLGLINNVRGDLKLDKNGTEELVNKVLAGRALSFQQRRWITRLLRICKETYCEKEIDPEEVLELGYEHEIFGVKAREDQIEEAIERILDCYEASQDISKLTSIDFCDMVWLPVVLGLEPPSRYQAILIDELQDISEPQFNLIRRVMLPTTRLIAVGDLNQAIYSWRGGLGARAWAIMQGEFNAKTLPLTTTFRCCQEVVEQANAIVPQLKAPADATGGTVTTIALKDLPNHFVGGLRDDGIHTFVLSRRNDDLLDTALFLYREKVRFQLASGKDLLGPLFDLLDHGLDTRTPAQFSDSLKAWYDKEKKRAEKLDSPSIADRAEQHFTMLARCNREVSHPLKIKGLLTAILAANRSGVLLSTVHKVKGLEADRVLLIKHSFGRHRAVAYSLSETDEEWRSPPPVPQEELNIEYVAITRAKWHLVWVDNYAEAETSIDDAIGSLALLGKEALKKSSIKELEIMFARAEREGQRLGDTKEAAQWFAYAKEVLAELSSRS